MNRVMIVLLSTLMAGSLSASAQLIAAWDNFVGSTAFVPTQQDPDTSVSVSTTTEHNNWGHWLNVGQSASADGTFGDLSETVASASTDFSSNTNALTLNRSNGTIEFTLTNNSGVDRVMGGFYFDSVCKFGNSAKNWELSVSGAISGDPSSGPVPQVNGGFVAATPEQRDHSVDLSTLTDGIWETGQSIVLTLAFAGAANTGSGGGNELLVDNIAVTVGGEAPPSHPITDFLIHPSSPGEMLLTWTSKVGRAYDVVSSPALGAAEDPAWSVIPALSNIVADSDATTVTTQVEVANAEFYRVEQLPVLPLFFDDFESGAPGWISGITVGATEWELGTPAFGAFTNAYSGTNAWATNLDDGYVVNDNLWLRSPPIDLTGVAAADLRFYHTHDLEVDTGTPYDFGKVHILATNGTILATAIYTATGTDAEWKQVSVSMPTQTLDQVIVLEFELESDNFQPRTMAGWHIDDVTIVEGAAPPPPPPPYSTTVTNLVLVDSSSTNVPPPVVANLVEGAVIDLDADGIASTNLNVRAETDGSTGSVVFSLTGATTHDQTESVSPYYLYGDAAGVPADGTLNAGVNTLVATPFEAAGGNGDAGTNLTVNFTITFTP